MSAASAPGILPASFFAQDTVQVARALLGAHLLVADHTDPDAAPKLLRVVETEAYTQDDPACHAYGRKSGRAATLYKQPGLSYVYLIYGMYHCLNVVTEPEGTAGAVLFRALEPVEPATLTAKTHGPGRLTRALNIRREFHNELDMTNPTSPLQLLAGEPVDDANIVQTTRIGISLAKDYPWRFYIKDNPWVSVR